jgi:TonB family protein
MSLRCIAVLVLGVLVFCNVPIQAENRVAKKRVQPSYPELARKMHVAGSVKLEVEVDPEGQVKDVKVTSGHALLRDAAVSAVKNWVYEKAPAKSTEMIEITFQQ